MRCSSRSLVLLLCLALAACEGATYLGQAAWGQAQLIAARRPIEKLLADPATPAALRGQLERVRAIRRFAREQLAMEAAKGFDSYAATGREYAVWNVVAAPELSVEPLEWCFPVVGCVAYRGYFARDSAVRFAAGLADAGNETYVYGVAAYSTLGWFDDPVLDTWAKRDEGALAALIIHELSHQLVYAPDDTAFSEGFAQVVEREGVRRWFQAAGRDEEFLKWQREQRIDSEFAALLESARQRLAAVYALPLGAAEKRTRKAQVFGELRTDYERLKATWPPGYAYDRFMSGPLDNARLATVANYEQRRHALAVLLAQQDGELPRFYAAARELAALPRAERSERLDALEHEAVALDHAAVRAPVVPGRRFDAVILRAAPAS